MFFPPCAVSGAVQTRGRESGFDACSSVVAPFRACGGTMDIGIIGLGKMHYRLEGGRVRGILSHVQWCAGGMLGHGGRFAVTRLGPGNLLVPFVLCEGGKKAVCNGFGSGLQRPSARAVLHAGKPLSARGTWTMDMTRCRESPRATIKRVAHPKGTTRGCLHVDEFVRVDEAIFADKGLSRCANSLLAIGSEGDVGSARVPAVEGPFCFAVADEEQSRRGHDVCSGREPVDVAGDGDGGSGPTEGNGEARRGGAGRVVLSEP